MSSASQAPFQGIGHLSQTFQSSQVHTPFYLDRITNSGIMYNEYVQQKRSWLNKPRWGNSSLLKGSDTRSLPLTKSEIQQKFFQDHLNRTHKHFGGGELSYGRFFPTAVKYDVTRLKRSDVRATDEIIPNSNKADLSRDAIRLPFPQEHPQNSHTPKFALFPSQDSPDNIHNGRLALSRSTSLPATAASQVNDCVVAEKISGSAHRREITTTQRDSQRMPLRWHGHNFNQLCSDVDLREKQCYPTPQTTVKPDYWDRSAHLSVTPKTAETQQYIADVLSRHSEYSREFNRTNDNCISSQEKVEMKPSVEQNNLSVDVDNHLNKTTYAEDYSVDVTDNPNSLKSKPASGIIRDSALSKKSGQEKRNKSVKFSNSVTVSDGNQTTSSSVNDIAKVEYMQNLNTPAELPITTGTGKITRPQTGPSYQRQSLLHTTPLLFPGTLSMTSPQEISSPFRPNSTGFLGISLRNDLRRVQDNYNRSAIHRKFNNEYQEKAPDLRRVPDTRITMNERRHVIPEIGYNTYYFHG